MAAEWGEGLDPYQLLGLTKGPETTEAELKKAYKVLALRKHPDKNPNNPNAAAEFALVVKAYEILSDPKARAALDDLARARAAREARHAGQDAKRRRMREELEARERTATTERSEEAAARERLQAELDRLRAKAADKAAAAQAERQAAAATASTSAADGTSAATTDIPSEQLGRMLKVSWNRKEREYSAAEVRDLLGVHGKVEDVALLEPRKKKSKASAVVVMASQAAASAACDAVNGSTDSPLLVLPFLKVATLGSAAAGPPSATPPPSPAAAAPPLRNPFMLRSRHAADGATYRAATTSVPAQAHGGSLGSGTAGGPTLFPGGTGGASNPCTAFPGFPSAASAAASGAADGAAPTVPSMPSAPAFPFGNANRDFESVTLTRMRQAAERAKLIAQLRAEEQEGEETTS